MGTVPDISGKVTVGVPVEQAFRVFTSSFGSWWPRDYHYGQAEMAEAILESGEGGRWFERGVDGSERDWGRVLVWEPPQRLVVTWQTNGQGQYDPIPITPARSRCGSPPTARSRPWSSWSTGTWTGWPAATPSAA